jgi:hypothetical protein
MMGVLAGKLAAKREECAPVADGTFEPQIVPKGENRLDGFADKIISLYARGMTVSQSALAITIRTLLITRIHFQLATCYVVAANPEKRRFGGRHVLWWSTVALFW